MNNDKAAELALLKTKRNNIIKNIQNIKTWIEGTVGLNEFSISCRIPILDKYFSDICGVLTKIEELEPANNSRSEIESLFCDTKSLMLQKLKNLQPVQLSSTLNSSTSVHHTNRLPKLKLPTFDGKYSEYKRFISSFTDLVDHDSSLSTIDKFNYLLNCLSGTALTAIKSFEVCEDNYSKALNHLKDRFDKKGLIFSDHIEALFNLPTLSKGDSVQLRQMLDTVAALRGSLLSLGSEIDVMNALVIHIILNKVDTETKIYYDRNQDHSALPIWATFYKLLGDHCQFLETNSTSKAHKIPTRSNHPLKPEVRSNTFVNANLHCIKCNADHMLHSCPQFLCLSIQGRIDFAINSRLCLNCLKKGHFVNTCSSLMRCRVCKGSHHTALHKGRSNDGNSTNRPNAISETQPAPTSLVARCQRYSLLPTVVILIQDKCGRLHPIRALLDSGSELNFITEEAAKRLNLRFLKASHCVSGISDVQTNVRYAVSAIMKSRLTSFTWQSHLAVTKRISGDLPHHVYTTSSWNIPSHISLADPSFHKPQHIDVLLSANVFFEVLMGEKLSLGEGLPHLVNTKLGWILGGQVPIKGESIASICNLAQSTPHDELTSIVRKFWEVEEFCCSPSPKFTDEEEKCEEHFIKNTKFNSNGRVEVRLPFKNSPETLGLSLEQARRRFLCLERRLGRDSTLKTLYVEFMEEYISLNHMTPINNFDVSQPHYVIPHHGVLKPQSTSTKLRAVFDASASTSSGISLNEILMVGPTIQHDLTTLSLSFRLHKYALTADIQKMYRQFMVHPDDRKFQIILWRSDPSLPLQFYHLNTVTYGMSSAPFLAIRSLSFIADHYKSEFPIGSSILKTDLYVDDLLTGAHDIERVTQIKDELIRILSKAGLSLAKWNSNEPSLVNHTEDEVKIWLENDNITKTLGMSWKPRSDNFCFHFDLSEAQPSTKRSILSVTARVYDLLGLLSPITIRCKMLLQEIWLLGLDWDSPIPLKIEQSWSAIKSDLEYMNTIEIPRFVFTSPEDDCEIHGFADASERAYGCCIYVRTVSKKNTKTSLLIAKSKVAPLKAQSLPRLELCAALLLNRVWQKIRNKIVPYTTKIYFWTDSKIVLHWLRMHSSKLKSFVANRISELQDGCAEVQWRHVRSADNPADLVSRGVRAQELSKTIWFSGPSFLVMPSDKWPKDEIITNPSDKIIDLRSKTALLVSTTSTSIIFNVIQNRSSFHQIIRIISYLFRMFNRVLPNRLLMLQDILHITHIELRDTFFRIISAIQAAEFKSEISCLQTNRPLKPIFQRLSPFLTNMTLSHGNCLILRVGGRLANANIPYDAKFPALLPKENRFTRLFIEHLHRKHLHASPRVLLSLLQTQVWVIGARELVRKVVRQCTHCFHYKPKLLSQIMADLPADRLKAQRPFLVSGVDLCGPFPTTYRIRGRPPYKSYIAVFICFATKAVHIEVVSDLSTNMFILCLKRFIARRGIPNIIYCDNATNFVGTSNQLKQLGDNLFGNNGQTQLNQFAARVGLEFKFIPPRAPHFGGLWEAAVKSMKHLLIRNIAQISLTAEELLTIAVEAEAILNSRPLTSLSTDPNDGVAITPSHFLIGDSLLSVPEHFDISSTNINNLSRFQNISYLKQRLWDLWHRDYIRTLQMRSKWLQSTDDIKLGTLVVIHEDNMPPQQWVLGRIVGVFPGRDGRVRVADVKTTKGVIRRPIQKLAPIPIPESV